MDNHIILNNIDTHKNKVEYKFEVSGKWKKYFISNSYYIEYDKEINLEKVPKSILSIPFIANILPLAWVFNAEIQVEKLDEEFYKCIPNIKKGYQDMYPKIEFMGNLKVEKIENNNYESSGQSLVFFSGGLDAYSTLVTHIKEKPLLLTLWGADVGVNDEKRWKIIEKALKEEAKRFELRDIIVRTAFREIFNYKNLDRYIKQKANDGWWHGFQHGIAIITHAAPICYINKLKIIYIASSYTKDCREVCASDPTIDDCVKIAGTETFHDGFEFNQGEKVKNIGNYLKKSNKKIKLRVCLSPNATKNCCKCEKCYRRIMDIIANGLDPKDLGFDCNENTFINMQKDFKNKIMLRHTKHWERIQSEFKNKYDIFKNDSRVNWIFNFDFQKNNNRPIKYFNRYKAGIIRRINKRKNKNEEK